MSENTFWGFFMSPKKDFSPQKIVVHGGPTPPLDPPEAQYPAQTYSVGIAWHCRLLNFFQFGCQNLKVNLISINYLRASSVCSATHNPMQCHLYRAVGIRKALCVVDGWGLTTPFHHLGGWGSPPTQCHTAGHP